MSANPHIYSPNDERMNQLSVIACGAAVSIATATAQTPASEIGDLMERVSSWLTLLEPALSEVVAEEQLTQRYLGTFRRAQRRVLVSTVSFARLPGDGAWLGMREVRRVNDRPIPETID